MAPHQARIPLAGSGNGLLKARGVGMKRSGNAQTRPQVVASALAAQEGNGWTGSGIASGIVNSASRMLTKGATFLLNSIYKRQTACITAPPPPASVVAAEETEEEVPPLEVEQPLNEREDMAEAQDAEACVAPTDKSVNNDSLQFADLETILKEKDLTREECEHYIELIRSKVVDNEAQPNISPWRLKSNPATASFKNEDPVTPRDLSKTLFLKNEVSVEVTRPREVTFSSPLVNEAKAPESLSENITRPRGWTPIQRPVTGGKELLKRRATALDEPSSYASPARTPLNLRGPTFIRSPAMKRDIDLSCFRKTTNARTPLRLDVPSVPRQSSRTARTILNTMDQRSPFKDPHRGSESKQVLSEVVLPSRTMLHATSSGFSGFSFPSSAHGPEPPTPKPMPSPYTLNKPRDNLDEPSNVKNGLLPSFQLKGAATDMSSYPKEGTFDMEKMAERVVSSFLGGNRGDAAPALTNSPTFSNAVGDGMASFETGSSSRGDDQQLANPFGAFSGSVTGTGLAATTTKTTTTVQTRESVLFAVPEGNLVGTQSLAPPDTSPANHSNGNGLPGVEKVSKRRKSAKRLK